MTTESSSWFLSLFIMQTLPLEMHSHALGFKAAFLPVVVPRTYKPLGSFISVYFQILRDSFVT